MKIGAWTFWAVKNYFGEFVFMPIDFEINDIPTDNRLGVMLVQASWHIIRCEVLF